MFHNRELGQGSKDSDRNRQLIKEDKGTPENGSGLESFKKVKKLWFWAADSGDSCPFCSAFVGPGRLFSGSMSYLSSWSGASGLSLLSLSSFTC